jgi:hypothetical protein
VDFYSIWPGIAVLALIWALASTPLFKWAGQSADPDAVKGRDP